MPNSLLTKLVQKPPTVVGAIALSMFGLTSNPLEIQAKPPTPANSRITQANLPTLRLGMRGAAVKELQTLLKQRGFYRSRITDNFDTRTQAAVRTAQAIYRLPKTGVVNAATWQALRNSGPIVTLLPDGAPTATVSGAGRGGVCLGTDTSVTALVPKNLGLTVSGRPTFFFSVHQTDAKVKQADFSLVDENGNFVYKTTIDLPQVSQAIGITIPADDTPELQVDKTYTWTFSIICNPQDRGDDVYATGFIQRVNRPDLVAKIKQTSTRDIPSVYAEAGIWHDMLTNLAELRRANPNDEFLLEEWASYLSSVGLNNVALEPLMQP